MKKKLLNKKISLLNSLMIINTAYQKLSNNLMDTIQQEEDPLILAELLKQYIFISDLVENKGSERQKTLLKMFEQLTKYEASRYI